MAFESLTDKLSAVFKRLRGKGRLSEADVKEAMKEIKMALLEADVPVEAADIHIHYHIGPGYAIPSPEGAAAVRRLARTEGILVDPVYTGKALAGFFQLLEEDSAFRDAENILFLHTGGAGALFAV